MRQYIPAGNQKLGELGGIHVSIRGRDYRTHNVTEVVLSMGESGLNH